ncbi:uncharacterized protein [Diadema setosum]|uniref:uncharacterized protein n=1 Tax=Diadema setosum TaxID=31175 RepID=UPI003B3A1053
MQTPSGKNVIPIFSKRKRPRQALYALPASQNASNQVQGEAVTPSKSHGDVSSAPQHGNWVGGQSSSQQRGRPPLAPTTANTSHTNEQWQRQSQPRGLENKPNAPGMMKVSQRQPAMKQDGRNYWPNGGGSHQPDKRQHMQAHSHPPPNKIARQYAPVQQDQMQMSPQYPVSSMQPPLTGSKLGPHQPPRTLPQDVLQSRTVPHTATSSHANAAIKTNTGAPLPFRMPPSPLSRVNAPPTSWEIKGPHTDEHRADTSMKILTVGIEELRHWASSKDCRGLVFFELFGILNSAVCADGRGIAKKFTIKDGHHTLQCIFYETDRPLGHLTRGQCLRCMGNIPPREGLFRCVSVRPASAVEQRVMRSLVAACDKVARHRLQVTNIEP